VVAGVRVEWCILSSFGGAVAPWRRLWRQICVRRLEL
jgi:hypothetical protein